MLKKGFSLAELSIVLIIIGLLVVGVTSGSKMIKTAKLQSLLSEISEFQNNVKTFRLTYDALPGDMTDAFDFFGVFNSCTDADMNTVSTGCNGNGDGIVIFSSEKLLVPIHLAKAELIGDIGYLGPGVGGPNMPIKSFQNVNSFYHYYVTGQGYFSDPGKNLYQMGLGSIGDAAFLSPRDAYFIDNKLDDGKPKSGQVTFRNTATSTDAACTGTSTSYDLSSSVEGCNLIVEAE